MLSSDVLEFVKCNLCRNSDFAPFFTENGYNVVRCRQCGLVLVNPQPIKKDYNIDCHKVSDYRDYIKQYVKNEIGHHTRALRILEKIETFEKDKGRILEIGCAAGFFLKVAQTQGWSCHGIEPVKPLAEYGIKHFGLKIQNSSFEQADFPNHFFDVIVAFNVLSHVKDPTHFFRKTNLLLKEKGLFVFETGNKGELDTWEKGKILLEEWLIPEHLYHFSEETLSLLIEKTGFETKKIEQLHVVDILLLEENLIVKRGSNLKWFIKRMILYSDNLKLVFGKILKFFYINFMKANNCSILAFATKEQNRRSSIMDGKR